MNISPPRIEAAVPWATGLLLAIPALIAFYPPMTDLPYHEAAIGILRRFSDPSMFPPGLYRRNLGEPNQLFHMIGWALSYVMTTRWAVKVLVVATIVSIPPCAARLARHIGASPLATVLVAPMAVGWLLYWGLITNLIGLAALLALLPDLDRFAQVPTRRGALVNLGAVVLIYFAHEAMMFLYAGAALAFAILYPWTPRRTLARLLPFVAAGVITVAQAKWQLRFMTPTVRGVPTLWDSFGHKLKKIPYIISPATDWPVLAGMSVLCLLTIAALFWLRRRERQGTASGVSSAETWLQRTRAWALAHRWEAFALVCIGAYFAFPLTLNGATFVYHRWFPPGFAVLAIAAAPRNLFVRPARAVLVALGALPVATLLTTWPAFAESSRAYLALEPLLGLVERGSSVAGLDLGPGDPTRTYSLGPAAGRILATRGGRLVFAFTDSAVSPVVISRRYQWTESLVRVGFDSYAFRPAQDLCRFRYLLVRANDPSLALLGARVLSPEAEWLGAGGEWMLFKSRLPTVPLLSHDFWLNGPPPESVRDRIRAVMASQTTDSDLHDSATETPAPDPPSAAR